MMNTIKYLIISFLFFTMSFVQAHDFEADSIPKTVVPLAGKSKLELSRKYFKDGKQSLHWIWTNPNAVLRFSDTKIKSVVSSFNRRSGLKIWIYNEQAKKNPLTFNFKDENNIVKYTFNFNLNFTGWRAAWIAYSDMWTPEGGRTKEEDVVLLEIVAPDDIHTGELWLDRVEFAEYVDRQATPDAQIPENNRHLNREIWHWGLLHKWEKLAYDIPLPSQLTIEEENDLAIVYKNIKNEVKGKSLSLKEKEELIRLVDIFTISEDGLRGAPLLQKDNLKDGDVHYEQLNDLMDLSARSWYIDNDKWSRSVFIKAIKYMLNQGFAYESGMGTNHHYGYNIRDMAGSIWWMEDVLKKENLWEDAQRAIEYWSGLQETRHPYNEFRDETTDSWNTLLLSRFAAAMMRNTKEERYRAMTGLTRWVNGSIRFTPGTIGGIKVDGTSFHHGGHYPAYSVPGFASIGHYLSLVNGTKFTLDERSREVFKFALISLARQMNLRDWGLGASGRHPFHAGYGNISKKGIIAFAHAAQAFSPIDKELAGHYLRLMEGVEVNNENKQLIDLFSDHGIRKADNPDGFYVYNYASQGIYWYNNKMISLKGFTRNIWGSELYTKDNRFGRYQSYGSVQIIGTPSPKPAFGSHPITEEASRFTESGWDWNRNPGTTTIHLPFDKLESPFPGSDMLRQPESFAGASELENGKYGMFAIKLGELKRKNFTPSFRAHKSVFCFGNKIICVGSNITNDNADYDTETTLFQQNLLSPSERVEVNGENISQFPFSTTIEANENSSTVLKDVTGYYYYLPRNQKLSIEKKEQHSFENKNKKPTTGMFASAYINHEKAPSNDSYEYMILIDPTKSQLKGIAKDVTGYEVILNTKTAHIVRDIASNTRGYAIFEPLYSEGDEYVLQSDSDLMIMLRPDNDMLNVSICSPDLNLGEYTYTTSTSSQPIVSKVLLRGKYYLSVPNSDLEITYLDNNTQIASILRDGKPLSFSLSTSSL